MVFAFNNMVSGIGSILASWTFWKKPPKASPVKQIHTKRNAALGNAKQAELNMLCEQLFKKKELITSGKLQFIGLAKIKKRMGKKWEGLCKIVYDTAEEVIDKHLDKGDIFIRYQDDTYVIIFARASLQEGQVKAGLIAEEIRQRLFAMDEEELRDLEIRRAIGQIRTDAFADLDFSDMLGAIAEAEPIEEIEEDGPPLEIKAIEVDTQHARAKPALAAAKNGPAKLHYNYTPLWDTKRGALTTYLCLMGGESSESNTFDAHSALYDHKENGEKLFLDLKILEIVSHELENMERDGRKLFVVCPVQHSTLYHFDLYEKYKEQLDQIPMQRRQFLILLVMNMEESIIKDPYWFAAPLRQFCRHVFAEVPLRRDINFNYLRNSGVDVVGVKLDKSLGSEQQILTILNSFSARAKALKIPQTFVLDVTTLSLTTSVVCAGFSYIGGTAIHKVVSQPDSVHRYHHEDLLSALMQK